MSLPGLIAPFCSAPGDSPSSDVQQGTHPVTCWRTSRPFCEVTAPRCTLAAYGGPVALLLCQNLAWSGFLNLRHSAIIASHGGSNLHFPDNSALWTTSYRTFAIHRSSLVKRVLNNFAHCSIKWFSFLSLNWNSSSYVTCSDTCRARVFPSLCFAPSFYKCLLKLNSLKFLGSLRFTF